MCCCQATTGNVYIVVDIIFQRERDFVGGLICLGCCRPLYIVLYIPSPQQQHGGETKEKKKTISKAAHCLGVARSISSIISVVAVVLHIQLDTAVCV